MIEVEEHGTATGERDLQGQKASPLIPDDEEVVDVIPSRAAALSSPIGLAFAAAEELTIATGSG